MINDEKLQNARKEINAVDREMAELFVRRMKAVEAVAEYKKEHKMPIFDGTREKEVLAKNATLIADDKYRGYYTDFLFNLMEISKEYQAKLLERESMTDV